MKKITITPDNTIRQAMKTLDKTAEKCLIVVDDKQRILGTLTDGDLRRCILNGVDFNASIEGIYHPEPVVLIEGEFSENEASEIMKNRKLVLLPIINNNKQVVGYRTWQQVLGDKEFPVRKTLNIPVVIMAGGKGTRLEPFTQVLPKPLIPIHEKPVIEHIIERFRDFGINDFWITINYKSRIMRAFFEELDADYALRFLEEQKPLGTAGSLRYLAGKIEKPFLVTNCDILIEMDYEDLYKFHTDSGYDLTLVASMKNYVIPYGTCELNGEGHLDYIREKPEFSFLVNTGLYVLNPDILNIIPKGEKYHITHLIADAKNQGRHVGIYPIDDEAWIDIGQWTEYRQAVDRL